MPHLVLYPIHVLVKEILGGGFLCVPLLYVGSLGLWSPLYLIKTQVILWYY